MSRWVRLVSELIDSGSWARDSQNLHQKTGNHHDHNLRTMCPAQQPSWSTICMHSALSPDGKRGEVGELADRLRELGDGFAITATSNQSQ